MALQLSREKAPSSKDANKKLKRLLLIKMKKYLALKISQSLITTRKARGTYKQETSSK